MDDALELLQSVLARTPPHETIKLTAREAELIGTLDENALGPLAQSIAAIGAVEAIKRHGLFFREVTISDKA